MILNRAVKHPDAPPYPSYVRASIILGANIIQPVPGNPQRSKLTMITQVDPGGFTPPMIVNQVFLLLACIAQLDSSLFIFSVMCFGSDWLYEEY